MKKILSFILFGLISVNVCALEIKGADISYLTKQETAGVKFYAEGTETDLLTVMKRANVNWIRLRLWVNPAAEDSYAGLTGVISLSERVKEAGFKLLLDIHYSDTWADPSHQKIPSSWKNISNMDELLQTVSDYTGTVAEEFIAAGVVPDMVQTGNEITNGMLWPYGTTTNGNCKNLFTILNTISSILKQAWPETKIMIHLDSGCNPELSKWWFSQAIRYKLNYDVIGLSYYPFFQGPDMKILAKNISSLKKQTGKEVLVAETQYPWTSGWADDVRNMVGEGSTLCKNIPSSPEGQQKYLDELCQTVEKAGGSGVFYWEPAAVADTKFGSDIENLAWFDFDHNWLGTSFR